MKGLLSWTSPIEGESLEPEIEMQDKASQEALRRWDAVAAEVALDGRPFRELSPEERQARLHRLRGIGKGLLPSSEEFLSQKREEIDREEHLQRVKRRFSHIPLEVSLAEELIAERRAEAGREEKE